MAQKNIAAGCRHRTQKCSGFDAVSDHLVGAPMQSVNALNADTAGAVALNPSTHRNQHFSQVRNFRLLGGIFLKSFSPLG